VQQPLPQSAPPESERQPAPLPFHVAFGGDALLRVGVTPDPVMALSFFVELELTSLTPTPMLRASFERSWTDEIDDDRGSATFRWTAGALEGCSFQWSAGSFRASPCVRFEAGTLEGEGSDIVPAKAKRRTWLALGAVGQAEWTFLEPLTLDFGAGLVVPLIRDRFFFQPDTTLYRPPAVGGLVRAGLGVRFP
jgi:hypothetical protein